MDHSRIVRIAVVGAGLMGHGIAQEFALAGYQVRLHDLSDERLRTALTDIRANLQELSSLGRLEHAQIDPVLAGITVSTDLGRTVSGAELVIEAIVEELDGSRGGHRLSGTRDTWVAPTSVRFRSWWG